MSVENKEVIKDSAVVIEKPKKEKTTSTKTEQKKVLKELNDDVSLDIKSNVYGFMRFTNPKTKETTVWKEYGEIQELTVGDIKTIRGSHAGFFEDAMISILGCSSSEYQNWSQEELYSELKLSKYISYIADTNNIEEIFTWPVEKIMNDIPKLPVGLKQTILVGANTHIKNGMLDSLKTIRALEAALDCELGDVE